MKLRTFWVILAAMAAIRLALMATVPVFEPSEARYAAISANMARSGDFVVPHFTHNLEYQSFDGKPPLVFQAGGLFCKVFGVCEFAVRLFPFLSAVLLLLILHHAVKRFSDAETGRLVRMKSDRGVVVVTDPRLVTKNYGATFRKSIPASVHTVTELDDLFRRVDDFFRS